MNIVNNKASTIILTLAIVTLLVTMYNTVFGFILAIVLIINGLIYLYITNNLNKTKTAPNQNWSILKSQNVIVVILIAALIALALVIYLKIATPEDTWLCQNGQWVKHGQPSTPQPTDGCQ